MQTMHERVAGLDVHQATVVATVRVPGGDGRQSETQTFGTMTRDLLTLGAWLAAHAVTHVAMESTGVYWKPVYYALEAQATLTLLDLKQLKHVPGRKTDVRDSEWIAQLLEWGLLRGSFVPPPPIRELRDLTRYHTQQVRDRAQEVNRLCKVLEDAGVKMSTVLSDIMGVSGRAMLDALVAGRTDPTALAELARGRLRSKLPALQQALTGRFSRHHAFLVGQILAKIDFLEETIEHLTEQIEIHLIPFESTVQSLDSLPGVDRRTAAIVIAETGADMRVFPSAAHLCSWAALCPGNDESAGKRRSGRTRSGNPYLRGALIQNALSAARKKDSALRSRYLNVKARRGHKRAVVAVAHQLLEIAYYLMRDGGTYQELGGDYLTRRDAERAMRRHVNRLEALGYSVTVEKKVA